MNKKTVLEIQMSAEPADIFFQKLSELGTPLSFQKTLDILIIRLGILERTCLTYGRKFCDPEAYEIDREINVVETTISRIAKKTKVKDEVNH
jgi:hypothetical protein